MNSILLIILSIFGLFYQVLTLNEITLYNYIPNILIPLLIFSHFYLHINLHSILFFVIGIALDCSNPPLFGTYTLSFMVLSYIISTIRNHIDLHVFVNKLVMILICNGIFYLLYNLFVGIAFRQSFLTPIISLFISMILNTIISLFVIGLLDFIRLLKFEYPNE
ncbi:hypothetical protein JEZ13_07500 [bacterium]|nr:hypothetical protein [bacterium]